VNITEQWHHTGLIELERALLTFGLGSQIGDEFLVAADGGPKDIVLSRIIVLEIHGRTYLYNSDVRIEAEFLLVDHL
jgi:hypothetical protein